MDLEGGLPQLVPGRKSIKIEGEESTDLEKAVRRNTKIWVSNTFVLDGDRELEKGSRSRWRLEVGKTSLRERGLLSAED